VVLSDKQGKALFVGRQLPSLESGKVYELWTINQSVVPAGTFTPTTQTSLVSLPDAALDASKIAVSVEPTGGSPQPTTTPIMVLSVPPAS
jgi:anti-sigma-K factor RskA